MESNRTRLITRTAILLAFTIVFQFVGRYLTPYIGTNSNFIVGPLVNACLLIAAATVGLSGAAVVAILAPFGAILTGAAIPLAFAPFISAGNFIIAFGFYILMRKNRLGGILLGSFLKFGFLYAAIRVFLHFVKQPAKMGLALLISFGWPQLVTALLGGMIALAVIQALGRNMELNHD